MKAAAFSTPESRAAFAHVKAFVRANTPREFIDGHALALVGESQETQDAAIGQACNEMLSGFAQEGAPEYFGYACTTALVHLVRERIAEIEAQVSGRA